MPPKEEVKFGHLLKGIALFPEHLPTAQSRGHLSPTNAPTNRASHSYVNSTIWKILQFDNINGSDSCCDYVINLLWGYVVLWSHSEIKIRREFVNMRVTWYGGCSAVIKTDGVSNAQWRSRSYHLQSIRTIEVEDCSNAKVSRMMMDLVG